MIKKYNKLVRDRIPEIIEFNGGRPHVRNLNNEEFDEALGRKAVEEAQELADSMTLEERADLQAVLDEIDIRKGFTPELITKAKREKAEERGGFEQRIFLESVEE